MEILYDGVCTYARGCNLYAGNYTIRIRNTHQIHPFYTHRRLVISRDLVNGFPKLKVMLYYQRKEVEVVGTIYRHGNMVEDNPFQWLEDYVRYLNTLCIGCNYCRHLDDFDMWFCKRFSNKNYINTAFYYEDGRIVNKRNRCREYSSSDEEIKVNNIFL